MLVLEKEKAMKDLFDKVKTLKVQLKQLNISNNNKEFQRLYYTILHDLKNPLISMDGLLSLFIQNNEDKINAYDKQLLQRVVKNVKNMEGIIHGLLEYLQIGQVVEIKSNVNINGLFESVAKGFENILVKNDIKLNISVSKDCTIYTSEKELKQILNHILDNAVKFMGEAETREIELLCNEKDEKNIEICVKDTGMGIAQEDHEKIFELFKKSYIFDEIENSYGAGLTLAKKMVEALNGTIRLESDLGLGASFYIQLPRGTEDELK